MKFSSFKTAALVIVLVASVALPNNALANYRSKCSPARDLEMDTCASRMGFLGDHSFRVPKNVSAMGSFCQELKTSLNCIQAYARDCLQGFTKQILTSLLKRGKAQYNVVCQDDKAKGEFLNKMSCVQDNKIDKLHSCMDASVARFEFIRTQVRPEHRLATLCCSYHIFNRDLDSNLNQICGPPQGESGIHEFLRKVVGGTTGEFFQLICENHRTFAQCQASDKTRDSIGKLEQLTAASHAGKIKNKSKSLIPPLLDILDSSGSV